MKIKLFCIIYFMFINDSISFKFNKINLNKITCSKFNLSPKKNIKFKIPDDYVNSLVFTSWIVNDYNLLYNYNINNHQIYETIFCIMTLIWQYVGLFIISHDLHHNKNPSFYQNFLGRLCLFCYGGFRLEDFSKNHNLHHKFPGLINKDPDFDNSYPIIWYSKFIYRYISINQLVNEIIIFQLLYFTKVNFENMLLFWFIPCIYASIQLYYYGTYLVHKENGMIINSNLPKFAKLLTCYNFGNHKEHHKYPNKSWLELWDNIEN